VAAVLLSASTAFMVGEQPAGATTLTINGSYTVPAGATHLRIIATPR
jgi:hypothetical protein